MQKLNKKSVCKNIFQSENCKIRNVGCFLLQQYQEAYQGRRNAFGEPYKELY